MTAATDPSDIIPAFWDSLVKLDETNPCRKGREHSWRPETAVLVEYETGKFMKQKAFRCGACRFIFGIGKAEYESGP